jgi:tetratricopeptide (TPR) repeat protein
VSVALADTATGREVWVEEYHRKVTDFMRIQEEIAELVVASVETEVERVEIRRALLMPSSNLDAWSAYHRGLHHLYKFTPSDCARAAAFLERSVVLEPDVPRPYAALSFVHFERAFLRIGGDRQRDIARAFDLAHQSLAIDPRDPMGHWALSRAYLLTGELQTAKSALHTAVDINPSYAVAQYTLGWVALQIGENDLCLDRVGFARRLSPYDPLSFAMLGVYALNLAIMGRTNEAASIALQSTLRPNAHHLALAFAAVTHALDGQTDCARDLLSRTRSVHPGYGLEDFLAVFQFQRENDIALLRGAFAAMETASPRRRAPQHDA